MVLHEVKIKSEFLDAIIDGKKTFEIRKNDRGYRVGDRVRMSDGERYLIVLIKYLTDFAQQEGYVVFSFEWIQGGKEQIRKQDEAPQAGADSSHDKPSDFGDCDWCYVKDLEQDGCHKVDDDFVCDICHFGHLESLKSGD